jgi:hypothetical protein
MRVAVRTTGVVILALVGTVLLALTSTTAVVALAATTALIMGGTGHPLSTPPDTISYVQQFMGAAVGNFISPSSGIPVEAYNAVAVITPETVAPDSVADGKVALHNCITKPATDCVYNSNFGDAPAAGDTFVVFGYSQSATIATLEKRSLAAEFPVGQGPSVSFVVIGNANRPNGGFYARDPEGVAMPTNTQYRTVDIALQYDGWADFPVNPLNLLADVNAYLGMMNVHHTYGNYSLSDPGVINQGQFGDTTYYMIPTPILPLLTPLEQLPMIGHALADTLDAPLRVLVEAGYNRTISPGQPTPWNLLYSPNPFALAVNFAVAIPTGWDNGLQDLFGIRPFGTLRPGPYGVGGPAVTHLNPPATTATTQPTPPTIPAPVGQLTNIRNDDAKSVMADAAVFNQLTSVLNGGVPVSISQPLSTAAGSPLVTIPTTGVPAPVAAASQSFSAQNLTTPSQDVPVSISSTTDTLTLSSNATSSLSAANGTAPGPAIAAVAREARVNHDEVTPIPAPATKIDAPAPEVGTPPADNNGVSTQNAASQDGRSTHRATETPSTPLTRVVSKAAVPKLRGPAGSDLSGVKSLARSLADAFNKPSTTTSITDGGGSDSGRSTSPTGGSTGTDND